MWQANFWEVYDPSVQKVLNDLHRTLLPRDTNSASSDRHSVFMLRPITEYYVKQK
jgi:hypothetical protein